MLGHMPLKMTQTVEAVKEKTGRIMNEVTKEDLQHCFEGWKLHMQWSGVNL